MVDIAVVGAGLGGLTTAALATADGLAVVVFEAHRRPGGSAGDYWRRGLLLPAGAPLFSGFEPGGLHDGVTLSGLNAYRDVRAGAAARRLVPSRRRAPQVSSVPCP